MLSGRNAALAEEFAKGKRGGHVLRATHLEWKELLTESGRFKTPAPFLTAVCVERIGDSTERLEVTVSVTHY